MAGLRILELANLLAEPDERNIGFSSDRLPDPPALTPIAELVDTVVDLHRTGSVDRIAGSHMAVGQHRGLEIRVRAIRETDAHVQLHGGLH